MAYFNRYYENNNYSELMRFVSSVAKEKSEKN